MSPSPHHRAIIRIISAKPLSKVNYSRRMYAIIRRYTPEAVEGGVNECFAELTGLRTFFKMTYAELADAIRNDIAKEIGGTFSVRVASISEFENALKGSKKTKVVATYKEMNTLFAGRGFMQASERKTVRSRLVTKKIRLTIPFLGKVA